MEENLSNAPFERRVLGAALRHASARDLILQRLTAEDFTDTQHRALYQALSDRALHNRAFDFQLIVQDLKNTSAGIENPMEFAMDVHESPGALVAMDEYVQGIRSCTNARRLMQLANSMIANALTTDGDPQAVDAALLEADTAIRDMTDEVVQVEWESIGTLAGKVTDEDSALEPLFKSGFPDLDAIIQGGFRAGQVVVVAARPGQGKSTLSVDFSRAASLRQGVPGLFVSLEMGAPELAARLLSAEGAIPLTSIQRNQISEEDAIILDGVVERVGKSPFYIVDEIESTLPAVAGVIKAAHRRLGIKYAVIDYVQLIASDGSNNKNFNREQIVSNISRSVKGIAKSLGITIFLVAQLNRGPEQRADNKPMLSDLRESGQIEQDADMAFMIFQPQTYDQHTPRGGEADVMVVKQRNGPTGVATLHFQGHYARFVSAAPAEMSHDGSSSSSSSAQA